MDCWDMTFGQLKSSYFEECDGVHNSKLWILCDMTLLELISAMRLRYHHGSNWAKGLWKVTIAKCDVQSNQKMHDRYATKHISQMVLPDAFWAV